MAVSKQMVILERFLTVPGQEELSRSSQIGFWGWEILLRRVVTAMKWGFQVKAVEGLLIYR
jgi:hypothetical protein